MQGLEHENLEGLVCDLITNQQKIVPTILHRNSGFEAYSFGPRRMLPEETSMQGSVVFIELKPKRGDFGHLLGDFLSDLTTTAKGAGLTLMGMKQVFFSQTQFKYFMTNHLKIKSIDDDAYERLRTTKRTKKFINNAYNYDILTNFRYADLFFYTQMSMREDGDDVSDYVSRKIYLGADKV